MNQEKKSSKKNDYCEGTDFNFGIFFFGLMIVLIGLAVLVNSLGLMQINFNFWQLWPLIIIFAGLSMISKKGWFANIIAVITLLLAVFVILAAVFLPGNYFKTDSQPQTIPLTITKDANADSVKLYVEAGAGEINVLGGAGVENAVEGILTSNFMELERSSSLNSQTSEQIISIKEKQRSEVSLTGKISNSLTLNLNETTPVDLDLKNGASSANVDLSSIIAKSVNVEAGAATLNLKLGSRADVNNVSIDSGASTINVSVPYGVGVKVSLEAGLSTTNLNNLVKIDDNNFESTDYDTATKKINIVLRLGVATFNLNWYMPSQNVTMRKIDLYYYKQSADPEITCGSSAVLPVEREIPLTSTPIQDAINLLIKGELTAAEKAEGFSTEFPNKDFKLLGANLDSSGVLTLTFTEVPGFTGGGSCRISILANQIIKTAEQFPEVKQVVFMPESLFQP